MLHCGSKARFIIFCLYSLTKICILPKWTYKLYKCQARLSMSNRCRCGGVILRHEYVQVLEIFQKYFPDFSYNSPRFAANFSSCFPPKDAKSGHDNNDILTNLRSLGPTVNRSSSVCYRLTLFHAGVVFLPASIAYMIATYLFGTLAHKIGR